LPKGKRGFFLLFTEDDLSEFFYRQDGDRWVYDLK